MSNTVTQLDDALAVEQQAIGAMITLGDNPHEINNAITSSGVGAGDFFGKRHRVAFRHLADMAGEGPPGFDAEMVTRRLTADPQLAELGGGDFATEAVDSVVATAHLLPKYLQRVREAGRQRRLADKLHNLNKQADNGANAAELLDGLLQLTADAECDGQITRRTLLVKTGDQIEDADTPYLWHQRLAMGAINIIFSRPGRGKSTLGAALTAHVTTGMPWPDGYACPKGEVLYLKGEGSDAAIKARMTLAGADPAMYAIVGRADGGGDAMIDLANDMPLVAEHLDKHPDTKLIIVDTLDSMYPTMRAIDSANVRRCLWPLQELAEQRGVAVIVFAHTNKGGHADPMDRLSGSRAIGASARSIWYIGKTDPDDDDNHVAAVKANDFKAAGSLAFTIVGDGPNRPGRVEWLADAPEVSAWDLDGPRKSDISDGESKAERCRAWMQEALATGPMEFGAFSSAATAEGFGRRVMKRTRDELGVKTIPQKGSVPPVRYACLPGQCPAPLQTPDVVRLDSSPESNVTTSEPMAGRARIEPGDDA